ncbi:hypothetical protein ACQR5W_05135 [Xanthomonas sacchari]|uniref:hypothetical protein n=1 Tax=Xanthomonas sp. SHU 308 TaxID=1591201 RepID=UPI000370E7B1|nr:hypothetical protein [Xanthomonas sp. SHU 308]
MPSPTPARLIDPSNRVFGTIDIKNYRFVGEQLPSTYYMSGTGPFIRLRPLHRSGFAIYERPTRVVGLYAGDWDRDDTFAQNIQNVALYRELGASAADIAASIERLKLVARRTDEIIQQNTAQPLELNDAVVFVNEGALAGTVWGGDKQKTGNVYKPLKVVDATGTSRKAHAGHAFATREAVERFYADYYPHVLGQLMLLGQAQQSFVSQAPNGDDVVTVINTDTGYFPQSEFPTRASQLQFLLQQFMRFA